MNTYEADNGTIKWWLDLADRIESLESRTARIEHQNKVRQAIGNHIDRLVAWNTRVCDRLDVSVTMGRGI